MAHSLVGFYGMLGDMRRLRDLIPESYVNDAALRQKGEDDHGIGLLSGDDDCPAFDRLWKYCRAYAVNDIVLPINEFLGSFRCVIYVDIDWHRDNSFRRAECLRGLLAAKKSVAPLI
ncbi:hypothetical protein OsI_12247 [Oryza sativa Indica Group]|uniref:Uncharacterized protein n=1 Tax=Oryza sativa subsp. indica TaxID=39946 RepID=B8AKS5_ORYSI|nr:hypothetical protein OsI_12247 [Oryza sativa Indica Group]